MPPLCISSFQIHTHTHISKGSVPRAFPDVLHHQLQFFVEFVSVYSAVYRYTLPKQTESDYTSDTMIERAHLTRPPFSFCFLGGERKIQNVKGFHQPKGNTKCQPGLSQTIHFPPFSFRGCASPGSPTFENSGLGRTLKQQQGTWKVTKDSLILGADCFRCFALD